MPAAPGPQRTCVGCRQVVPAHELVRFVLVGDVLTPDPSRHAPGRGAWLHADPQCVSLAAQRRGFARSLRRPVDAALLNRWP